MSGTESLAHGLAACEPGSMPTGTTSSRCIGGRAGLATLPWVLGLLVVAALAASPAAFAQYERRVQIDYYIDRDGRGMLIVNTPPDGWGYVTWERCPPDGSACQPIDSARGERRLRVGDAEPGTVFKVTASDSRTTITERSDPYRGPRAVAEPPRIEGDLRVGALVRPIEGSWEGGWGGEPPIFQLQACRDEAGTECKVISATPYWDRCPGTGAVLAPRYEGWWVRVADHRWARRPAFPAFAVRRPEDLTAYTPSPITATATAGPIRPPQGPPESTCGDAESYPWPPPKPSAVATAGLSRSISRRHAPVVARVTCPRACQTVLVVRQGRRRIILARGLRAGTSRAALTLSRRQVARLRRGRAGVQLRIDGRREAAGTIRVL